MRNTNGIRKAPEKNIGVRMGGRLLRKLDQECRREHVTYTHVIKQMLLERYGLAPQHEPRADWQIIPGRR